MYPEWHKWHHHSNHTRYFQGAKQYNSNLSTEERKRVN